MNHTINFNSTKIINKPTSTLSETTPYLKQQQQQQKGKNQKKKKNPMLLKTNFAITTISGWWISYIKSSIL